MKKVLLLISVIALSLVFSGITYAAQVTGSLQVTANVEMGCVFTTNAVTFGGSKGDTTVDGEGDIYISCPLDQTYNITLDAGLNYDGSNRKIIYSTYGAVYNLYKDQPRTTEWGDSDYASTYPAGTSLQATGTGSTEQHTVYGRLNTFTGIPMSTTLTDTVTVTVYY